MWRLHRSCLCLFLLGVTHNGLAQTVITDTTSYITVAAGAEYSKPKSYQKLWGYNRRIEWTTPVRAPKIWLDKVEGGFTLEKTSGGNETKVLKLTAANGKEYALRSINKLRDDVVPKEFKGTFIEDIIQDGVSMSHPYGAFALPVMEKATGIYHAEPKLVYVPQQPALDSLNEEYGNNLYMIEERLSCDWSDADHLGNFKEFLGTDELVEKIQEDNTNRADQFAFVKARLFDMLLADWDRHEDQWKWGERKRGGRTTYIPVPRDRDQVFYTHNGFVIDRALPAIGNGYMQHFDHDSKDITKLNYEEKNIDPFFTNEMTMDDWVNAAKSLQQALTDTVIEQSVRGLPPEIFQVSGQELINKLLSRRSHLVKYATQYYLVLAREVEIVASKKKEYFEVSTAGNGDMAIKIFAINDEGQKDKTAFYSRVFKPSETKTIRVFGIGGEDIYSIDDKGTAIRLSIIGGPGRDSLVQQANGNRIHIYDNRQNNFETTNARLHTSSDSAIHTFNYFGHETDKKGFIPEVFYSDEDRIYVGLRYGFTTYKWRREPFATRQLINVHYSLSQKAFSVTYSAEFPNMIGKWNLSLLANYDAVRWTNFFGLGNETLLPAFDRHFYRMRTREWLGKAGINRQFGKSTVSISGYFQSAKIIVDTERYVAKVFLRESNDPYKTNNYAGAQLVYSFVKINDSIVPVNGVIFLANAYYFSNIVKKEFFQKYLAKFQVYIPLSNKFSLAIKTGGSTIVADPGLLKTAAIYEHSIIGGPGSLRGFRRERFWGQSAFYNNNELRFITNIKTHWLNARFGVLAFFDNGRVWMPGENSNTWHTGYGGGILFAPFRKISATITYGLSKDSGVVQASVYKIFK